MVSYAEIIKRAIEAREFAYVPYSNFFVGAAVATEDGKIYTGCNIENSSYGATNCGERTAIFNAVSQGSKELTAIAIVGGYKGELTGYCAPCGICRQVMTEFANPETFSVILAKTPEDYQVYLLKDLLPLIDSPQGDLSRSFVREE